MEFILSKTLNFFTYPLNILLTIAFIIILFFFFNKKKIIKCFSLLFIFLFIFFGIYSLPYFLLNKLEDYIKPSKISYSQLTGVVVLGGGIEQGLVSKERNEASLSEHAERLTKAVEIFKKNPRVIILFSGSGGPLKQQQGWSDSDNTRKFFIEQGVREENLIFENQSRNTFENVKYSKKILEDKKGNWGLITSASHMARSFMVFKKNGIILEPISVDYKTGTSKIFWLTFNFYKAVKLWNVLLHEITGIVYYKLTDKI